jgi:bifunctional ADP-heptose synthase (sugar kinase/adenylyltransferase)
VASVFTLTIATGATGELAARLATLAAGVVVGKRGTTSVAPSELLESAEWRSNTEPTVICPA